MVKYTDDEFQKNYELVRTMARVIANIDFIELKRHVESLPAEDVNTDFVEKTMKALDKFNALKSHLLPNRE